jgi:hypothetical protein
LCLFAWLLAEGVVSVRWWFWVPSCLVLYITQKINWVFVTFMQWLLGRGVETMQEVINSEFSTETTGDVQRQQPLSKIDTNHVGWTSRLDPDVGDYCILLASKPRVRAGTNGAESSSIVTCATMRAVLALKRCGLPVSSNLKTFVPIHF